MAHIKPCGDDVIKRIYEIKEKGMEKMDSHTLV